MLALNYAVSYLQALTQAFPYVLNFGALYSTPNNGRYKWVNSRTIQIPSLATTGRIDGDRDTVGSTTRNYENSWEPKTLSNHREWSTLIHPNDIIETGGVATIQNITQVYNEEQKFPEMDAYTVSKIYADWVARSKVAIAIALTVDNVLQQFDKIMLAMDEARIPASGRILYVTPAVKQLIQTAKEVQRTVNVTDGGTKYNRIVTDIDNVEIIAVPSELMKTIYDFTLGWKPAATAKQIQMFLVHPLSVITPITYDFAKLDEPSATSKGKYVYFEESFEDVFILNKKVNGIQFIIEAA